MDENLISNTEKIFLEVCGLQKDVEAIKELLKQRTDSNLKFNVNVVNDYGWTPLMRAVFYNHTDIVTLLLKEEDVDVNAANNNGETAFFLGCQFGKLEAVELMLKNENVDINQIRNDGWSPLMGVCYWGKTDIVKVLLASWRDIDVDRKFPNGRTLIEEALERRKIKIVHILERFMDDPKQTRIELRNQLGLSCKFYCYYNFHSDPYHFIN